MLKRLEQHLESNHILAAEQFGFRKGISIENAVFTVTNNVLTELNQRHQVGGIKQVILLWNQRERTLLAYIVS